MEYEFVSDSITSSRSQITRDVVLLLDKRKETPTCLLQLYESNWLFVAREECHNGEDTCSICVGVDFMIVSTVPPRVGAGR